MEVDLPPIRVPDRSWEDYQLHERSHRASNALQPKEKKVVDSIMSHLNYQIEDTFEFISEIAQGV